MKVETLKINSSKIEFYDDYVKGENKDLLNNIIITFFNSLNNLEDCNSEQNRK